MGGNTHRVSCLVKRFQFLRDAAVPLKDRRPVELRFVLKFDLVLVQQQTSCRFLLLCHALIEVDR
jgi:hypothetical protein